MEERRKFERFGITVPARVEIPSCGGCGEVLDLETCNLSAGGTILKFGRVLPEGSPLKIEIALQFEEMKTSEDPEGTVIIAATGQVQRSGPEGMAIRFNEEYDIGPRLNFIQPVK